MKTAPSPNSDSQQNSLSFGVEERSPMNLSLSPCKFEFGESPDMWLEDNYDP